MSLLFAWAKQKKKIEHEYCVQKAVGIFGIKARRLVGEKRVRRLLSNPKKSAIEKNATGGLLKRQNDRKPITVPWFVRIMKKECERLQDLGYSHMIRCTEMNCGWSWCWRCLVRNGFVSRRRGCKRPFAKQFIQDTMEK